MLRNLIIEIDYLATGSCTYTPASNMWQNTPKPSLLNDKFSDVCNRVFVFSRKVCNQTDRL